MKLIYIYPVGKEEKSSLITWISKSLVLVSRQKCQADAQYKPLHVDGL